MKNTETKKCGGTHTMRYLFFAYVGLCAGCYVVGFAAWIVDGSQVGFWAHAGAIAGLMMIIPLAKLCGEESKAEIAKMIPEHEQRTEIDTTKMKYTCDNCAHTVDGKPCDCIYYARTDVRECVYHSDYRPPGQPTWSVIAGMPTVIHECECVDEQGDSPCPIHGEE